LGGEIEFPGKGGKFSPPRNFVDPWGLGGGGGVLVMFRGRV